LKRFPPGTHHSTWQLGVSLSICDRYHTCFAVLRCAV
jgi:hypothetical protein